MLRNIIILVALIALKACHSTQLSNEKEHNKLSSISSNDRMPHSLQMQQFSSTKERPEFNSVLSELINEDIKMSIEAKRQSLNVDIEPIKIGDTTTVASTLTTERNLPKSVNEGLVDQSIMLDEAGSEQKQTSRIQTKKGPNGIDYEYEYVYYYYDEDERGNDSKGSMEKKHRTESEDTSRGSSGKSLYTTLDRSGGTTAATPAAASPPSSPPPLPSSTSSQSREKSRKQQQSPSDSEQQIIEETSEERLPLNTRFPPRSNNNITPSTSPSGNEQDTNTNKRNSVNVKHPSLELVDSHSFNRDDKVNGKASYMFGNEFTPKGSSTIDVDKKHFSPSEDSIGIGISDITEQTTPIMEKAAFDLYAILANANSNESGSGSVTDTTDTNDIDLSTVNNNAVVAKSDIENEGTTSISTMTPTTTTTTTTATTSTTPVTTTATTTTTITTPQPVRTTTTTTTTTEPPISIGSGRKTPFGPGRNRFRLRPQQSKSVEVETSSEAPPPPQFKSNRFSRPNNGISSSRSRSPVTTTTTTAATVERSTTATGRGRHRSSFRATTTTSAPNREQIEDNVIESTKKITGSRPSFQLQSRIRTTTNGPITSAIKATTPNSYEVSEVQNEEKKLLTTKPFRFALNRPNRLPNRSRPLTPLPSQKAGPVGNLTGGKGANGPDDDIGGMTPIAGQQSDQDGTDALRVEENTGNPLNENEHGDTGDGPAMTEANVAPQNSLSRLKNRPRIQINASTPKPKATPPLQVNRKINPLVARRKLGGNVSTTSEQPLPSAEDDDLLENGPEQNNETSSEVKKETTETVEMASQEPSRGLGLLGNRRRPPLRRPGTIL